MPAHATRVSAVPPAQGSSAGGGAGGGAPPRPTAPRLRAVPSIPPGVADVPVSPKDQERFYQVHEALLSLGARAMTNADDFERDLKRDQDELELQELGKMQNGDDSRPGSQQQVDFAAEALRSLPTSQASSKSQTSEAEVAHILLGARAASSVTEKPLPPSQAGRPAFHLYGLDEEDDSAQLQGAEDPEDEIENPDDASPPPPMAGAGRDGQEVLDEGPPDDDETEEDDGDDDDEKSEPASTGASRSASQETITHLATANKPTARIKMRVPTTGSKLATTHDRMKSLTTPAEPNEIQQFLDFWQKHVSKINPPHVWYRQHTAPSSVANGNPPPAMYSCKLTLVMPNATKRTFETAASYSDPPAARMRAFLDARESGTLEAARKLREELGWQVEEQEAAEEREKVRSLKGGEKPWETLRAEQEKWMAPPIKARLDKDELNAVYGCALTVQSSLSSPPLTFAVPIAFSTQREARAAAARLALEADIPEQYQRAVNDLIKGDRHGYIQVADFTATEAAMIGETAQAEPEQSGEREEAREDDGERKGGDDEARRDAVDTLYEHVKAAFGSRKQWVSWTYEHAKQDMDKPTRGPPNLGAPLTIKIPVTEKHPSAPPPFVVSTERRYRTKHHARLACATTAFSNDLLSLLVPYRKEREEAKREKVERKAKQAEERRKEREAGKSAETPQAGTVKYEDLESLQNPATYLNICAQQWTGNGSPLKFEYTTRSIEDGNIKLYGCTLTVFINISLSRTCEVPPSPEYKNRAAAKEAAIRLALKERVLDLLTPAGFDPSAPPLTAAAASRLARAARGREPMEVDPPGASSGASEDAANTAEPVDNPAARSPRSKDAVSRLDEFVQDWVGPGCLPQYDIFRDERSGLYGGSLCIPLASGTAHEDLEDPSSKLVPNWSRTMNFATTSVSRTQAQQHFAQSALDDDIVQFMQEHVPRHSEAAPPLEACECGVQGGSSTSPYKHGRSESDVECEGDGSGHHEDATRDFETLMSSPPPKKRAKLDLTAQSESLIGKEGGSVERLRLGCRATLGTEADVGPRYKMEGHDDAFGASVTIPLDPEWSYWRTFGVTPIHTSRELACEAAASCALDAGILELIESRVRPKARPAPPVGLSAESRDSKSVDKPGVALATQVPKHGEELAAARRAMYGDSGAATQYQLQEIERKLEAEVKAEKEREEGRREEERKAEELKRMGNPLLPSGFATAEALLSLDKANSTATSTTTTPQPNSPLNALKAYCERHQLAFPQFHALPLSEPSSSGEPRSRIWLILRGLKFELPRVRASVAEERLAEKVVAHLKKLDDQTAAAVAAGKEA